MYAWATCGSFFHNSLTCSPYYGYWNDTQKCTEQHDTNVHNMRHCDCDCVTACSNFNISRLFDVVAILLIDLHYHLLVADFFHYWMSSVIITSDRGVSGLCNEITKLVALCIDASFSFQVAALIICTCYYVLQSTVRPAIAWIRNLMRRHQSLACFRLTIEHFL